MAFFTIVFDTVPSVCCTWAGKMASNFAQIWKTSVDNSSLEHSTNAGYDHSDGQPYLETIIYGFLFSFYFVSLKNCVLLVQIIHYWMISFYSFLLPMSCKKYFLTGTYHPSSFNYSVLFSVISLTLFVLASLPCEFWILKCTWGTKCAGFPNFPSFSSFKYDLH